jgi:leucyl/phenylalanyl-tRNA--protein transferase
MLHFGNIACFRNEARYDVVNRLVLPNESANSSFILHPSSFILHPSMPILPPSRFFPPAEDADPEGFIGFGGELTPQWLLDAYQHGIFPWPMGERDSATPWFSPDPRAVIDFEKFHVPRRLLRVCKSNRFEVCFDRDFPGVIRGCAAGRGRKGGTWLTSKMITAYIHMHELGHAHSVEAWQDGRLVGGVYGLGIAGLFAAESMFYRVPEASKVALVHLVNHLKCRGYELLDIQQLTPNTARFGAIEIPREEYLRRLKEALEKPVEFASSLPSPFGRGAGGEGKSW